MGRMDVLKMKVDQPEQNNLINSDLEELGSAATKLANHLLIALGSAGLGTTILKWTATIAAIYLLILDRTHWRTNMLTALLVPYIFFCLPSGLFSILSGDFGKWVAIIAVILRLFFPSRFPDWLELPGSLILIIVVAPYFFATTIRDDFIGAIICLIIGAYLLQEHIRASGGFRASFTERHGISNTLGIIVLLVYPMWRLIALVV